MFRKSFKNKIILPVVAVLIVLVGVLIAFLSVRFTMFTNSLINEKLVTNVNNLKLYLEEGQASSYAAVDVMVNNPSVIKAIKKRDREELLRLFTPMIGLQRINFYTICDSKGIVLARAHDPDSFGDSLIYQQNIKDAINGKVSSSFEEGTAVKVSISTVAPVYETNGALAGILFSGVRFDSHSEAAELKKLLNSEVTVLLGDAMIATTVLVDGQNIAGTKFDPKVEAIAIDNRQEYAGNFDLFGETYKGFYQPLLNARGEAFAAIVAGMPLAGLKKEANILIRDGIGIGLIGLAISIVVLFFIFSSISKPLISLSKDMDDFADGDLHVNIDIKSEDEIGHLGKSLQKAIDIIHKLIEDIETMITEQNSGNSDYCLDVGSFKGEYKQLADNISKLVGLGMKDQLTGIANRRSFDNRLLWEWQLSKREKKPVSVLMLDLDRFKYYNDTFGHQQGDMALVTVATILVQSLKRTADFVARWGGEEFVILLPNTHARGARSVAERIRKNIEEAEIPCADKGAKKLTISIGVNTQIPDLKTIPAESNFIADADTALYKAKAMGRNRVCQHGDP